MSLVAALAVAGVAYARNEAVLIPPAVTDRATLFGAVPAGLGALHGYLSLWTAMMSMYEGTY
jgi:hypothetical protein